MHNYLFYILNFNVLEVPSSTPVLSGSPDMQEGTYTTFTCTSNGGEPEARFQWYVFDGVNEANLTASSTVGTNSSTLTLQGFRENNTHRVICRVVQLEERQPQEDSVELNVTCKYLPLLFVYSYSNLALTLMNRYTSRC